MASLRRRSLLCGSAVVVAAATVVGAANSSSASVQYVAGSSSAFAPVWSSTLQLWQYKCAFAGWDHVQVNWTCQLVLVSNGVVESQHTGSFSGGSANPGWYSYKKSPSTAMCTVAYAAYFDGSDHDRDEKCN